MSQRLSKGPDDRESSRFCGWTALACALIVVAGIAAYSDSFTGPFVFDDLAAIQDNSTLRHFPARENLIPPAENPISRRPVVNLTFALNYALDGLDVRGFHAGNLLIHLLAALTLFGVVRRTLLLPTLRDRFGRVSTGVATAVALIWAMHPLQTESVTYLTQRMESLMGLLYLLTLYCFIRATAPRLNHQDTKTPRTTTEISTTGTHPGTATCRAVAGGNARLEKTERNGRTVLFRAFPWLKPSFWWSVAAVVICALGMGAKEVMASAPIIVLLYDRSFLSGSFREALRRRWPLYLGLAATWGILGALLVAYPQGGKTGAGFGLAAVGPWEYARTQPAVILHYLALSFWPRSLCLDYSWPVAVTFRQIAPAAAAVLLLLAGTVWALRRAPALGFLGAWFFLILAPTSSIVPITDLCFEHRMYLPLAALVAGAVVAAYWLGERFVRRFAASPGTQKFAGCAAATAAVLSVAGLLGVLTFDRNLDYRDAVALWADTAQKRPLNARAQQSLGTAYLEAGRADLAIERLNRAIELKPDLFFAWNNLGAAEVHAGRTTEAVRDYDKAIALRPDSAAAYTGRAVAWLRAGRYDLAFADYNKAIALQPDDAGGYNNLGIACMEVQRMDEAIRAYSRAIALNGDYAEAYNNRGVAYSASNRPAEAIQDYDRCIEINPRYAEAFYNRAVANFKLGRYDLVLRDCDTAIALRPSYAEAYSNRAAAHANLGQFGPAVSDSDRAIALKPDYREAYINRAAAYSQIGRYEEALADVDTFQRLGGQPQEAFVKALLKAAGRAQ